MVYIYTLYIFIGPYKKGHKKWLCLQCVTKKKGKDRFWLVKADVTFFKSENEEGFRRPPTTILWCEVYFFEIFRKIQNLKVKYMYVSDFEITVAEFLYYSEIANTRCKRMIKSQHVWRGFYCRILFGIYLKMWFEAAYWIVGNFTLCQSTVEKCFLYLIKRQRALKFKQISHCFM